jgi:cytochrome d ubiquinol oxidase subunit II
MEIETLQFLWYLVFIAAMFAYAALDGFDIGVGCLHLFAKSDYDRRIFLNAIGPVWDSNSLWVIIISGALLAGFPIAFSTLYSALYLPMMVLVFGYIYRAVAIEFRSKIVGKKWRIYWDIMFFFSSICLAIGFGIVLANLIRGLPIDSTGWFVKEQSELFSPYACLLGVFTTLLFMLHGALYLAMKTTGPLHARLQRWCVRVCIPFSLCWVIVNIITPIFYPHVTGLILDSPIFIPLVVLGLGGLYGVYRGILKKSYGLAFLANTCVILSLVICYAIGTYPNIVRSDLHDAYSLTIFNSSSTATTLKILLGIALAGVPLFCMYMSYTYRVFRGKVELDTMSY